MFGVYVAVAYPLILFKLGTYHWFLRDDWLFITSRSITWDSLFSDHDSHWSTLPVLVFRLLYKVFGLNSYRPYQAVVLLAHVAVVVQARLVLRRAASTLGWPCAWRAPSCSSLRVVRTSCGPSRSGSRVRSRSAAQLLLADHPGAFGHRDVVGLGCGLLALMCSGTAVTMVIAVGLALLIGRGWRRAALHTVPLAAVRDLVACRAAADGDRLLRSARRQRRAALGADRHRGRVLGARPLPGRFCALRRCARRRSRPDRAASPTGAIRGRRHRRPALRWRQPSASSWRDPVHGPDRAAPVGGGSAGRPGRRYLYLLAVLVVPAIGLAMHQEISRRVRGSRRCSWWCCSCP